MSGDDDGEKEFDASERKLQEARKRGELVKSTDIHVAASYGGFLIAAAGFGGATLIAFGTRSMVFLDQADSLSTLFLAGETGPVAGALGGILWSVAPWFLIPMLAVVASLVAQRAIVFAPEKLMPKFSRVNPITNAGQKFGRNGLFEFGKSFVKMMIVGLLLWWFLVSHMDRIMITQYMDPAISTAELAQMIVDFVFILLMLSIVFGGVDYFWQYFEHHRQQKMTRKEMTDEHKDSEGDPHMKGMRRQRAMEIANNKMLADVPKADVVVVNPTHYAVALKWDRASGRAPVCVAKGVDEIAARIREAAQAAGVPIHRDPPTARAMFATLKIGQEISPDHYKPVAAAIRFAEKMRRRAKDRRGW
ncbi:EscU/YscU/HrcU family type III secretion system export apparatus switch protein [Phaeovulum sp. W22_SRMD_FR3]|uniref:EscU/YscU/HrcU family type III secretion system export apparatus switch protein n=1 Tax=Phaeovulum sp. W22_SRMD_FR3 TaxID=3240274 RepID=UPI003F9BB0E3